MLYIHPILQGLITLLGFYALALAWPRFSSLHLGRNRPFNWKRHVLVGKIVLVGWLLGAGGGVYTSWSNWSGLGATGPHYPIGQIMAVMIIFGLVTGLRLDKKKKNGKILPLLHGINNLALIFLAIILAITGYRALEILVWSMM